MWSTANFVDESVIMGGQPLAYSTMGFLKRKLLPVRYLQVTSKDQVILKADWKQLSQARPRYGLL